MPRIWKSSPNKFIISAIHLSLWWQNPEVHDRYHTSSPLDTGFKDD
jgi:hypothetical protein